MKKRKMLVADLLCGAGGSSTGAARALKELGLEMELVCLNHWPTAIETHTLNHPEARHYVQDIATVRPNLIVPEGYLDLLMASPSCVHHSVARGGRPTSDQQRSDPWHIITWLTELRVKRLIIENVWEFTSWGPVDHRTGKPVKSRKGEYFQAWIDTIRRLGFEPEWHKLNAADFGDATTRQRFILMARSDGRRVQWPVATHEKQNAKKVELFSSTLKPWRPARDIIDWDIKGRSIFGRKKALAPKTLNRIYAGALKFGWPEPYLVILRNHMSAQGMDMPLPTIAANGNHIGLATPVIVNMKGKSTASTSEEPLPTQTAHAAHLFSAEPVIMNGRKGNEAKAVSVDPIPTLDTKGGVWLAEPMVLSQHNSGTARSTEQPLPTITTGGAAAEDHPGCARPMLVTVAHGNSPGDATADSRRSHSLEEPLGAIHGEGGTVGIVEPFVLNRHGDNGGVRAHSVDDPMPTADVRGAGYVVEPIVLSRQGGGVARSVEEPTPTQTAKHSHILISPYYGTGSGETCNSAEDPLPTITSKGRFGMVVPVTHSQGGNAARDANAPLPTLTTAKGGEFAVVLPVTHAGGEDRVQDVGDPLPTITGANRGELAFIAAQFGEREGQSPRVHDIDEPVPTIAATGHVNFVEPGQDFDILFRMLEPHELAAAMGFDDGEQKYEFAGNKTQKIKQIGNAVSVRKMKACVGAIMADAAPDHTEMKMAAE